MGDLSTDNPRLPYGTTDSDIDGPKRQNEERQDYRVHVEVSWKTVVSVDNPFPGEPLSFVYTLHHLHHYRDWVYDCASEPEAIAEATKRALDACNDKDADVRVSILWSE